MTSVEKTAFPRFSSSLQYPQTWLETHFSVSQEEVNFIEQHTYKPKLRLCLAIQLKTFQYLGYFIDLSKVPEAVIRHVRNALIIHHKVKAEYAHFTTAYRHRNTICEFLEVTRWCDVDQKNKVTPRRFSTQVAYEASQTMNNPADIINVVLESLSLRGYELPAFSTLDRLVRHVRYSVNRNIFKQITRQLNDQNLIKKFDELLQRSPDNNRSPYDTLKQLPRSPTVSHFRELLQHHNWLMEMGDMSRFTHDIAKVKLAQFAAQAKSLDASDMREMAGHTRYGLMVSFVLYAQHEAKDSLVTTYCKAIFKMHYKAGEELKRLQEKNADNARSMADFLMTLTQSVEEYSDDPGVLAQHILAQYDEQGGTERITETCQKVSAYNSKNYLPLLWAYCRSIRPVLLDVLQLLRPQSSTRHSALTTAMDSLLMYSGKGKKAKHLTFNEDIDLSFAAEVWKKLVFDTADSPRTVNRRYFELCLFTYVANELRSGDLYVQGAVSYGDYRRDLLPWSECVPLLNQYCSEVGLPNKATLFVAELKQKLTETAARVDKHYPKQSVLVIDDEGTPVIKRREKKTPKATKLHNEVKQRIQERHLVDILCNAHQHAGWADVFGPLSGSEPKLDNATERYIINTFCNGTGMGPAQTARHVKADITPRMLSWINRRHVNLKTLDAAITRLINYSNDFSITKALGDKNRCAADGTLRNIYEDNLIAETHYRYRNKGGIAYHHVADNYIALFSTFIPCGVWEAVEIIEGLLKNKSDIQPKTVHADTQGQSAPVFGLSYLFAIELMPRIRNWKDLTLFRPEKSTQYKHIDSLFSSSIDWELIETHWQDLMQIAISIKHGKVSSSTLLRKLSNYSRKNRLYLAFRELGRAVRTSFLLEYISDSELQDTITESTNKVEAYNGLSDWAFFASDYIVASNDPEAMEKAIKQNMVITNSIILQNLIDISQIIYQLQQEGWKITKEDVSRLSPYLTEHIKRFGEYIVELKKIPPIPETIMSVALF